MGCTAVFACLNFLPSYDVCPQLFALNCLPSTNLESSLETARTHQMAGSKIAEAEKLLALLDSSEEVIKMLTNAVVSNDLEQLEAAVNAADAINLEGTVSALFAALNCLPSTVRPQLFACLN